MIGGAAAVSWPAQHPCLLCAVQAGRSTRTSRSCSRSRRCARAAQRPSCAVLNRETDRPFKGSSPPMDKRPTDPLAHRLTPQHPYTLPSAPNADIQSAIQHVGARRLARTWYPLAQFFDAGTEICHLDMRPVSSTSPQRNSDRTTTVATTVNGACGSPSRAGSVNC